MTNVETSRRWPQISFVSSLISIILVPFSFIAGAITFRSEMSTLRSTIDRVEAHSVTTEDRVNSLSTHVTTIEGDVKWIGQGVAELRTLNLPKH